jgi:hypothetical protein
MMVEPVLSLMEIVSELNTGRIEKSPGNPKRQLSRPI